MINMKILFIAPRYSGGIGGHAYRVAQKLKDVGYDVELMHVPHIPIKNLKNPSFTIFGKIQTIINKKSYDLVHAWNVPSGIIMKNIERFSAIFVYEVNKNYSPLVYPIQP